MRCNQFIVVFSVALYGCASLPEEKSLPAPQDKILFVGGLAKLGANASRLGVQAMTQDELRVCATTIIALNDRSKSLSAENSILKGEKAKLTDDQKKLEMDRGKVVRTSSKQVDDFNKRLLAIQDSMRSLNGRVDNFNNAIDDTRKLSNSFNLDCANHPYRDVDLQILSQEQRQAMEAGAKPFDLPVYTDEPVPTNNASWLLQ